VVAINLKTVFNNYSCFIAIYFSHSHDTETSYAYTHVHRSVSRVQTQLFLSFQRLCGDHYSGNLIKSSSRCWWNYDSCLLSAQPS